MNSKTKTTTIRSLELFTGAGGLALGTHLTKFQHIALIEYDKSCCNTLRINAENNTVKGIKKWDVIEDDVKNIKYSDFKDIDFLAGGPPCQPFSLGGKAKGMDDERDMIPEFIRGLRELTPKAFIIENVKGLLRQSFRTYFSYVLLQLTYPTVTKQSNELWTDHLRRLEDIHTHGGFPDLHYNVIFRLLNAANYGVPQLRERVFIVGFRADTNLEWHFPEPTHSFERLLYDQWNTGAYWERHNIPKPDNESALLKIRPSISEQMSSSLPWQTVRDAISDLPKPKEKNTSGILDHYLVKGARTYPGHTGSLLDLPSKTIKAGNHGVPGGENMIAFADGSVRYFTVREAARIQTFPDTWTFAGSWSSAMKQIGNAVPVKLAEILGQSLANKIREKYE